jgi:DNA polymerase-3 subunit delta
LSYQAIKDKVETGRFAPVYVLCGEETFFIDDLANTIQQHVLTEAERDFNQHVFYARDTTPQDVVNVARKYPVFAERQLVMVKEAQHFRKWDAFQQYLENPVPTTVLVICHMHKGIDLRTGFGKLVKKKAEYYKADKIRDHKVPEWIGNYLGQYDKTIDRKSSALIVEHLGNDLAKIANELNKLVLNIPDVRKVSPAHIEDYIGISKDFNAFELSSAVARKDFARAMGIIRYFEQNPKAGPVVFVMTVLYNYFSKIFQLHHNRGLSDSDAAKLIRVYSTYFEDYKLGMANYTLNKTEDIISNIALYDARTKGVGNTGAVSPYELLKELLYRIMK